MSGIRCILTALLALVLIGGCSSSPPQAPPQDFTIAGQKVQFSPPPPEWKKREVTEDKEVTAVIFDLPNGANGHLAVTVMEGVEKLDKETLNRLAIAVVKRDGKIVKDTYVSVAGGQENAYRMEFALQSGERGLQVHFPEKGKLYSIVMTVPGDDFNTSAAIFDRVVSTFKLQ